MLAQAAIRSDPPVASTRSAAPIFVVGCPRSGTSFLYHMLLSAGHFPVYRTEPAVFDLLIPRFGDLRRASNRRKLVRCWLRSRQFRRSGLDARKIEPLILSSVTNGGEFLRATMDQMALAGGYARWAVWGPDNLLHIPTIKRQVPDALFLHIIRDGRDVACALDRKEFIRPFPWNRKDRVLVSGLHWKWRVATGRGYGREVGNDYLEIKFEDLVLSPRKVLASVGAFIGQELEYEKICQAGVGTLRVPNSSFPEELVSGEFSPVGRWARLLPEQQVLELESLIGESLVELGYGLSRPAREGFSVRLRGMRTLYPAFYDWKEWCKYRTPLGRFVDLNQLYLDDESDQIEMPNCFTNQDFSRPT